MWSPETHLNSFLNYVNIDNKKKKKQPVIHSSRLLLSAYQVDFKLTKFHRNEIEE